MLHTTVSTEGCSPGMSYRTAVDALNRGIATTGHRAVGTHA